MLLETKSANQHYRFLSSALSQDAIKSYLAEIAHCVSNAELVNSDYIYPLIASKCNHCYSFVKT